MQTKAKVRNVSHVPGALSLNDLQPALITEIRCKTKFINVDFLQLFDVLATI